MRLAALESSGSRKFLGSIYECGQKMETSPVDELLSIYLKIVECSFLARNQGGHIFASIPNVIEQKGIGR